MDLTVFVVVLAVVIPLAIILFMGIFKEVLDISAFGFFNAKISGLRSRINEPSKIMEMDIYELESFIVKFDRDFKKDFKITAESSPDSVEIFFRKFDLKYEKEILKNILRGIKTEPYGFFTKEMITKLQQTPLSEYSSKFEGTVYSKLSFNKPLAEMERDIDFLYYKEVLSAALQTDSKNASVLKTYIKSEIDVRNILTILRCKKYGIENVLDHVIPIGHEVPEWKLKNLAEARDVEGVLDLLTDTEYKFLSELREKYSETKSLFIFEKALKKYLLDLVRKLAILHPYTSAKALYYILLREKEVSDILGIYEAKKEEFDEILEDVIL